MAALGSVGERSSCQYTASHEPVCDSRDNLSPKTVDVLAIGAHPDDVEIHAGGKLLRLASLEYTTAIVDLTRGEASTRGTLAGVGGPTDRLRPLRAGGQDG